VKGHIIVTGCVGFIGSHLTDRLLADGHAVVGIDSFEDYYPRAIKEANLEGARANPAFAVHQANILELAAEAAPGGPEAGGAEGSALAALLRGCACLYHLAAQAGVRASWGGSFEVYTRTNVLATQQVLEACVAAEAPKVIYASSSSVYGDQDELPLREDMAPRPRSPYGSPGWPANTSAVSTTPTTGSIRCRCASSPCTARGSARTWRSTSVDSPLFSVI